MVWIKTEIEKFDNISGSKQQTPKLEKANILKIHTLNTETGKKHEDLYRSIMFGKSTLSRSQREMIAVVVSVANMCEY